MRHNISTNTKFIFCFIKDCITHVDYLFTKSKKITESVYLTETH